MMVPVLVSDSSRSSKRLAIPKSASLISPSAAEQDVGRFHVAVHDPHGMSRGECVEHLSGDTSGFLDGQRTGAREVLGQRRPVDDLHHDVEVALVLAGVEDGDRVPVAERGRGGALSKEPVTPCWIG